MSEPILVVDPGGAWTSAALVTTGESQVLKEPSSGSYCWPTSVALDGEVLRVGTIAERRKRSKPLLYAGQLTASLGSRTTVTLGDSRFESYELMAALLGVLRTEAERLAGAPVERILVLAPDAYSPATHAGQAMIAAAEAAGFADVELLFLPAAVTMAAGDNAAARPTAPGLTLVCDAGASAFRVTLIEIRDGQAGLARAQTSVVACGGNNLDTLLAQTMQGKNAKWLKPLLAAEGAAGERARLDLADLARRIRHELTDADRAEDTLTPLTPVVPFTRQDLERLMKPSMAQLASGCREMLARAGSSAPTGVSAAAKVSASPVSRVILVGGCGRTPAIQRTLSSALGHPVTPVPVPELAALRGGIEWAMSAVAHRVAAVPVPVGMRELSWEMPGDAARLIGWNVSPGAAYDPDEPLATIRAEDDAVWDLTDDKPGIMAQSYAGTGAIVATADVLAVTRTTSVTAADLRSRPLRHSVLPGGQFAALSRDGRQLATLDAAGTLRIWDAETTAELKRFEVKAPRKPKGLDAAMNANGDWLVAFFDGAAVVV